MSTIEERVSKLVCEQLGVKEEEVTLDASFVEDLGADSLDTVELVMLLKKNLRPKFLTTKQRRSRLLKKRSIILKPTPSLLYSNTKAAFTSVNAAFVFLTGSHPCHWNDSSAERLASSSD